MLINKEEKTRKKRRARCQNCGELSDELYDVYAFKTHEDYKYYTENKYEKDLEIKDYLDMSDKSLYCDYCIGDVEK